MTFRRALARLRALRGVRRGAALLMLVVLAVFLAAGSHDHCGEGHGHEPYHAQHLLCPDDCAPLLIPEPPAPPAPDPLPRPVYREAVAQRVLHFDLEPEKEPPRR